MLRKNGAPTQIVRGLFCSTLSGSIEMCVNRVVRGRRFGGEASLLALGYYLSAFQAVMTCAAQ